MGNKKRKTKKQRANEAEIAARVQEVIVCRLNGASFHDLQALATERGWSCSERTLWRYVQLADRQLAKHFEEDRATLFRRHVLQRRRLYALAIQDGDIRTALAVARDEATLFNLYPTPRTDPAALAGGNIVQVVVNMPDHGRDPQLIENHVDG